MESRQRPHQRPRLCLASSPASSSASPTLLTTLSVFVPKQGIFPDVRSHIRRFKSTLQRLHQRFPASPTLVKTLSRLFVIFDLFLEPISTQTLFLRKRTLHLRFSATFESQKHLQSISKHQIAWWICGFKQGIIK